MIVCTFAGHREVYKANISERLDNAIEEVLTSGDCFCFLVGGMGDFDSLCAGAVRKAKRKHPEKQITLDLILPYLTQKLNESKDYYEQFYDNVVIPMELADVHYKSAITKRNHWMVEQSNVIIAFVYRDFGGAFTTLKYAKKKGLQIINLAEERNNEEVP